MISSCCPAELGLQAHSSKKRKEKSRLRQKKSEKKEGTWKVKTEGKGSSISDEKWERSVKWLELEWRNMKPTYHCCNCWGIQVQHSHITLAHIMQKQIWVNHQMYSQLKAAVNHNSPMCTWGEFKLPHSVLFTQKAHTDCETRPNYRGTFVLGFHCICQWK